MLTIVLMHASVTIQHDIPDSALIDNQPEGYYTVKDCI